MRRISLAVHLPLHGCSEDFAAMPPAAGGRRCEACDRVVHDLSAMTAREANRFVAARRGVRTCYRYLARPDGSVVFAREPPRAALSAAVAVSLAACTPHGAPPQLDAAEAPAEAPAHAVAPVVIPSAPQHRPAPPEPATDEPDTPRPRPRAKKAAPAPREKPIEYLGFEG